MNRDCLNLQILNPEISSLKKKKIKTWFKKQDTKKFDWKELLKVAGEDYGYVNVKWDEKTKINKVMFQPKVEKSSISQKIEQLRNQRSGNVAKKEEKRNEPNQFQNLNPIQKKEFIWKIYRDLEKEMEKQKDSLTPPPPDSIETENGDAEAISQNMTSNDILKTILPNPDMVQKNKEMYRILLTSLPHENPFRFYLQLCFEYL